MQSAEIIDNYSDNPNFEDGTKHTAEQKRYFKNIMQNGSGKVS